jgi:hypothetical protein
MRAHNANPDAQSRPASGIHRFSNHFVVRAHGRAEQQFDGMPDRMTLMRCVEHGAEILEFRDDIHVATYVWDDEQGGLVFVPRVGG